MGPCVYCHRRSVADSEEGPLCAVCARDAAQDDSEADLWLRQQDDDGVNPCRFPKPCRCTDCVALAKAGLL